MPTDPIDDREQGATMTNQEINVACAKAMGYEGDGDPWMHHKTDRKSVHIDKDDIVGLHPNNWNPAESIADAWRLVEWARTKGARVRIDVWGTHGGGEAHFFDNDDNDGRSDDGPPLCICLAFLEWASRRRLRTTTP